MKLNYNKWINLKFLVRAYTISIISKSSEKENIPSIKKKIETLQYLQNLKI